MRNGDISAARAGFYAFLSRIFVEEPPRELVEDMAHGRFSLPDSYNKDLNEGIDILKKFNVSEKDAPEIYESLCLEYTRLFLGPVPVLFPYESMYIDGGMMGKSLLDVKKEYSSAGLGRAEGFHEPEDHIAMELGFMGHLCKRSSKENLMVQREFLKNHLLKWAPGFCDELCEKSRSDFYRGIGRFTKGFLYLEKNLLEELLSGDENRDKEYIIKSSTDY